MTTPQSETSAPSPQSSPGFTDPMKIKALTIKARIQSGETVPIEELIAFLNEGKADLGKKAAEKLRKEPKPTDVDFF